MAEFKGTAQRLEAEEAKATARLPGLDIEITHSRSADGDAERISINLQAVPSFEALGRYFEAANPFAFWIAATRLAWAPWLASSAAIADHCESAH